MIHPTTKVHPTAIIEEGAIVGEYTQIGAYSIIHKNVIIGKNNRISSHVVIDGNTEIGNDNSIDSFSLIGSEPQDPKYDGETTYTIIENNNRFKDRVHIDSGINITRIGNNNYFMTGSGIAHDSVIGNDNMFAPEVAILGSCILGNNINFGFLSGCHQGTKVGSYSMIGANTFIRKDVLPFSMLNGNPAKLMGPNYVGIKRCGFSKKDIKNVFAIFKLLTEKDRFTLKEKYDIIYSMDNNISKYIKDFLSI
jgi:UDP-N-acetylglucosamine acyltransferase